MLNEGTAFLVIQKVAEVRYMEFLTAEGVQVVAVFTSEKINGR